MEFFLNIRNVSNFSFIFSKNIDFSHKFFHSVSPKNDDSTNSNLENTSFRPVIEIYTVWKVELCCMK